MFISPCFSLFSILFLIFDLIALTSSILLISPSVSHILCNTSLLRLANLLVSYILPLFCFFHATIFRFFWLYMFLMGFLMYNRNTIQLYCAPLWTIFVFCLLFWVWFLLILCLKGQGWNIAGFVYHSDQCLKGLSQ